MTIPNQAIFRDNQNYEIDINQTYSFFIREIDASRSYVNITNGLNQSVLNSFKEETFDSIKQKLVVDQKVQESRAHAFYRLVGFPVVSSDNRIYNPGFDNLSGEERKVTTSYKIKIANEPIKGFKDLSIKRESYIQTMLNIFSYPNTIDASTLTLSSGLNVRKFVVPFDKDENPFDTKLENQSYSLNLDNKVGKNKVSLLNFEDVDNNEPEKLPFLKRSHIIKPFVVDARIDFSVSPSSRSVAIPFVFNKSNTMVGENTFVKRPLIEKVIRDRFDVINQSESIGDYNQSLIDYIKTTDSIDDLELVNKVSENDVYGVSDQAKFINFIQIIRAMIKKLVSSQNVIAETQSNYYYLPIPDSNGPEFGCTDGGVIQTSKPLLRTENDKAIINAVLKDAMNSINVETLDVNSDPDPDNFVFDQFFKLTTNTSQVTKDISKKNLDELTSRRKKMVNKMNDALKTIEIIMGEFNGFGLCDMIAITGALYLMPKENLIGFLDEDALSRMNDIMNLSESSVDIETAQTSLAQNVIGYYNIMDKIYEDEKKRNGK